MTSTLPASEGTWGGEPKGIPASGPQLHTQSAPFPPQLSHGQPKKPRCLLLSAAQANHAPSSFSISFSMTTLPSATKAPQICEDRETLNLVEIPFVPREDVQNSPDGYILLKVKAAGLDPANWKTGLYAYGHTGGILWCDAPGNVVAVGSGVTHLSIGDHATGFIIGHGFKELPGAFVEYVLFSAMALFKIPERQSYAAALALPIPLLTAVQTLYFKHNLTRPSELAATNTPVLIRGASTAFGHYAIQITSLSSYKVLATASPAIFDHAGVLGASEVFDYMDPETPARIRAVAPELSVALATYFPALTAVDMGVSVVHADYVDEEHLIPHMA